MAVNNSDRMGTAPVASLMWKTSIPLMLSLLVNSLYNLVDSVFVARISEEALTALSIAAPVQMLIGALGLGLAVGLNAAVSKALGERDRDEVRNIASASMLMAVVCWVLLSVLYLLIAEPYFRWQSGGNAQIAAYGKDYLSICMLCSLGCMGQWVFDRMLIATGRSVGFLITLSTASITNLILDPVFIFGFDMGTQGAAIATVIGQFAGAICGYFYNRRFNTEIPLHFTLRPKLRCVGSILRVGIPTTVMQVLVSVTGIAVNTILSGFSATAVAVSGLCIKLQNFVLIGPRGINNGLIPLIAYNYGAKKKERIYACLRWAVLDGFAFMAVILLLLELLPVPILRLFDASEQMMAMGVPAIRLLAVSWFGCVFGLSLGVAFQALGKGTYSMILTVTRQVILLLPLLLISAGMDSLPLVWLSYTAVELLALPVGLYLWRRVRRQIVEKI